MRIDEIIAMPGALLWVVCYLLILRRARLDRMVGMPLLALAGNISWEFLFGFVDPDEPPMDLVNRIWFFVDVALLWQIFRYGRAEHEARWPRGSFELVVLGSIGLAFSVMYGFHLEFDDSDGRYTGWGQNLLMSAAFLGMLLARRSSAGQSVWIALSKLLGTAILDVAQMVKTPSWPLEGGGPLMFVLYVACLVLDLLYLGLLIRQLRAEGRNPWRHW